VSHQLAQRAGTRSSAQERDLWLWYKCILIHPYTATQGASWLHYQLSSEPQLEWYAHLMAVCSCGPQLSPQITGFRASAPHWCRYAIQPTCHRLVSLVRASLPWNEKDPEGEYKTTTWSIGSFRTQTLLMLGTKCTFRAFARE